MKIFVVTSGQLSQSRDVQTKNEKRYWTVDELLDGITESPARERKGRRYMVICDETAHFASTKGQLSELVAYVYSVRPNVFKNADKGITIDFDRV